MKKNIPLMKNCRVDYKYTAGSNWSLLIDFTNDNVLYTSPGTLQLKTIYGDFKFAALNDLPIDNYNYLVIPQVTKLEGLKYYY